MADVRTNEAVVDNNDGEEMKRRIDSNRITIPEQQTFMFDAIKLKKNKIVSALLDKGISPDIVNSQSNTPLIQSLQSQNIPAMKMLLDKGADPNKVNTNNGNTPLIVAVLKEKDNSVKLLIEKGADPNKPHQKSKDTPLILAIKEFKYVSLEDLLNNGADPNKENTKTGMTPLLAAVDGMAPTPVRALIRKGADVNKENRINGETPLTYAIILKYVDIANILLELGADVNKPNRVQNNTPLILACSINNVDLVKSLLAKGADPNIRNKNGRIAFDLTTNSEIRRLLKPADAAAAPSVPYSGKSISDIEFFNLFLGKVDETTTDEQAKNIIRNTTFCPVCLANTMRVDGCLYMHHVCSDVSRHEDLYEKYKNDKGEIWWCVDCCRICAGHRHYKIGLANDAKPSLLPDGDPFARSCDGSDGSRTNGGGSTTEKLKRVARMIDYAFELQYAVGEITEEEAKNELVEEVWNSAITRMRFNPLKLKRWKTDISVFTDEKPTVETIPEAVPAEGDIQDPVIEIGSDPISLDNDIPVIQFRHKNKDGVMFDHIHPDGTKYFLGKASLIEFMKTMGEKLGKCFDDECGGWLWPQEIEKAFADPRLGVTDEDRALLAKYKERFNSAKAPKTGGARWKFNFVSEMENGECYLPPKKKAGNRTRKNRKLSKKTRRQK